MQTWEYLQEELPNSKKFKEKADEFGKQGWEMFHLRDYNSGTVTAYFKRQK
jgi:hypothetical protein